jgi:hypothetical protein
MKCTQLAKLVGWQKLVIKLAVDFVSLLANSLARMEYFISIWSHPGSLYVNAMISLNLKPQNTQMAKLVGWQKLVIKLAVDLVSFFANSLARME